MFKRNGASSAIQSTSLSQWLWSLVLLAVLSLLVYFLVSWNPWQPVDRQSLLEKDKPVEITQTNKHIEYRFYELLPKQQVSPLPDKPLSTATTVTTLPDITALEEDAQANKKIDYFLQVGSFDNADKADEKRALILLSNYPAQIVTNVVNGKKWYRVVAGPFKTLESAEQAKTNLSNNGIDTLLTRSVKK